MMVLIGGADFDGCETSIARALFKWTSVIQSASARQLLELEMNDKSFYKEASIALCN